WRPTDSAPRTPVPRSARESFRAAGRLLLPFVEVLVRVEPDHLGTSPSPVNSPGQPQELLGPAQALCGRERKVSDQMASPRVLHGLCRISRRRRLANPRRAPRPLVAPAPEVPPQ